MAKLSTHHAGKFVKLLLIGDSGTGKTGALTSLVKDGYKLRVIDMDNGLDSLRQWVAHDCKDKIDNVDFITLRDQMRVTSAGPMVTAKAYIQALKYMSEWDDGSKPSEDGEKSVFVLDSLTTLGKACFEWAKSQQPSAKDPRQWYFAAQQSLENVIAMLTSEAFATNVIVISHINYKEIQEGIHKGYPSAVGSAMGPTLPKYFNTMLQVEVQGSGKNTKRLIRTIPSAVIDLKNPAPFKMEGAYDISDGMALIFKQLKEV